MDKEIISCICMTCGIRNDHSHPDGRCQNDHDDWLEYRDVMAKNEFFKLACKLADETPEQFTKLFLDNEIKEIRMVNRPEVIFQFQWHHSQNNASYGGLSSKVTVCKWNGYYFYTRENINGIDSFNISSGERMGDKMGNKPRPERQTLEILCPTHIQETIHNIVKINDPLNRQTKWNRNFTLAWIEDQLKKDDDGKYKYRLSFSEFKREARQVGRGKGQAKG